MKWINYIIQFLFIRLTRHENRFIDSFELTEASVVMGGIGIGGRVTKEHTESWYSIQYWVVPLTGWKGGFKYLNGQKFKKLTKTKRKT